MPKKGLHCIRYHLSIVYIILDIVIHYWYSKTTKTMTPTNSYTSIHSAPNTRHSDILLV